MQNEVARNRGYYMIDVLRSIEANTIPGRLDDSSHRFEAGARLSYLSAG